MASVKILACGDVEGKFKQLFNRVVSIQKKAGPFEMLICVGNFFGDDNSEWALYKSGQLKVPISTLVLGPNKEEHIQYFQNLNDCELCENVTYLGRKGMYRGSSGLSVAYLSGLDGTQGSHPSDTHFNTSDVDALRIPLQGDSKIKGVDILLTSQWPKGVEKYANDIDGMKSDDVGSSVISQLAAVIKPRYHFAGLEGVFFERQPYRNHRVLVESAQHVTRFIALAKVGNPQKKKYLYAFNLEAMKSIDKSELVKQPQDATECPYQNDGSLDRNTEAAQTQEKGDQYFWSMGGGKAGQKGEKRGMGADSSGGPQQKKKHPQPTGPCWFCLGSPEVEKHLVVSIGTQCYLAKAKGGLVSDHMMILPIGHHQSTVSSPPEVIKEIEQYKTALRRCYKSQGKVVVFFERNYKTQHLQIQAVPIEEDFVDDIKETFQGCALSQDFELQEIPKMSDLKQIVPQGAPYFYVEMPSGEKLMRRISKGFPLQFGREAMAHASLLNMPQRADWRNCKESKDEEIQDSSQFRSSFEKFDFNL